MKKSILNLGEALNKASQQEILGGRPEGWTPNYCTLTCYPIYLAQSNQNGDVCYAIRHNTPCGQGTINNNECCV